MTELSLKILLASAHPYIPQIAGGAQSSTDELAAELKARGHEVSVLAGLAGRGWFGARARLRLKLGRRGYVTDDVMGYPAHRAWFPETVAAELVARERPDVVAVQSGRPVPMAAAFEALGVPTVVYLRNVEVDDLDGDPATLRRSKFVANSAFTSKWFKQRYDIESTVIHPLIHAERYVCKPSGEEVVFINPHPLKGSELALEIARRCPDIPFRFVEAWTLDGELRDSLEKAVAALPNVTLAPRTQDMRSIYAKARMILAPSQWQEAFGRIAAEAHLSGIPLVASRIGGLTEAVGPGGVLLDHDGPVEEWALAVRRLWEDDAFHEAKADEARRHAARPAMDPAAQIDELLAVLRSAIRAETAPA